MGSNASLLDLIAHGGSLRATQDNQQQAAQTQGIQASTALTNTQVPVQQEVAKQEAVKTQIAQRQLEGQKALQDYYARLHSQSQGAAPPVAIQAATPNAPLAATTDTQGAPAPVGAVAPGAAPLAATQSAPRAMGPSAVQGNPNAFFSDLTSNGVPPEMALQHVNSLLKYNQELAGLDTTQLENRLKRLSMAGDSVSGYIQNPTPEGYAQARSEVMKADPEHASLLPDPATNPLPSESQLATFLGVTGEVKKIAELRKEKQATATSAAQQKEAEAATARTAALTPLEVAQKDFENQRNARVLAGTNEQGLTADQQANLKREGESAAETVRHNKQAEFAQQREIALKQKTFDATLGSGLDANGQPLSPEAMKAAALQDPTAQAIANYQLAPPPAQTRGGVPSPILRKVLAINPQYDATTYPARSKTASAFSPAGPQGQAITAADTALSHLNTLSAAGAALNNGNVQKLNQLANFIGAQVGQSPKTTYDTIVNMVAPEISKAVIGAAGGEGERQGTATNYGSNLSNEQRESNIAATVGLLGARFDKAAHAYESEMGRPLQRTLSPESQAIRQKYSATAPGGASGGAQHKVGDSVKIGGKIVKITAIHGDGTFDGDESK